MKRMLTIALAAPVAVMLSAGVAAAGDPAHYAARLKPVPHDHEADGGSRVSGNVQMRLDGRRLTVHLRATGLTPDEAHAMHIHGNLEAKNECPGIDADLNTGDPVDPGSFIAGKPDGLISLSEGAPDYGPVQVSLTKTGDTSADSALTLERFVKADGKGRLDYERTFAIPGDVARDLSDLHVVVHGTDLPGDADHSSLSSLFEATLPVACGEIQHRDE